MQVSPDRRGGSAPEVGADNSSASTGWHGDDLHPDSLQKLKPPIDIASSSDSDATPSDKGTDDSASTPEPTSPRDAGTKLAPSEAPALEAHEQC